MRTGCIPCQLQLHAGWDAKLATPHVIRGIGCFQPILVPPGMWMCYSTSQAQTVHSTTGTAQRPVMRGAPAFIANRCTSSCMHACMLLCLQIPAHRWSSVLHSGECQASVWRQQPSACRPASGGCAVALRHWLMQVVCRVPKEVSGGSGTRVGNGVSMGSRVGTACACARQMPTVYLLHTFGA